MFRRSIRLLFHRSIHLRKQLSVYVFSDVISRTLMKIMDLYDSLGMSRWNNLYSFYNNHP